MHTFWVSPTAEAGILRFCPLKTRSISSIFILAAAIEDMDTPYCFDIELKVSPLPLKDFKKEGGTY